MQPGDIRSLALDACGYSSDPEVPDRDRGLVNRVERALNKVRNETCMEAARLAFDIGERTGSTRIGNEIQDLKHPEFSA